MATRTQKGIKVNTDPVANRHAGPGEFIIEFTRTETGAGGLMSIWQLPDGGLQVDLYRLENVQVTSPQHVRRHADGASD